MSTEDEDVLVKIEDETPADTSAEQQITKTEPETDPVAELKSQYEEEKSRREAAEARATQERKAAETERKRATEAETRVVDSELATVTSGIAAAQTEVDAAKSAIKAAIEAGDAAAQADAYDRLATARANISRLDEAKADIEARKTAPRTEAPQVTADDPVEKYISQCTAPTQKWMRDHIDWIKDPGKYRKVQQAHFHAMGEGLDPDTSEYFEHVEKRLGLRQERARNEQGQFVQTKPAQRREAAPPVAPVNGEGGGSVGTSSGTQIALSKGERRAAEDGTHVWGKHDLAAGRIKDASFVGRPIGIQEMARRKLWGQRQGLYDKSYAEG